MRAYSAGIEYKNVRFLRAVCFALGIRIVDSAENWAVWRSMSPSVSRKCKRFGMWEYETAVQFRNAMRSALHIRTYDFGDLICYFCLIPRCLL